MARKRLNKEAVFKLIMECRSSGLSDRQWCSNKGIPPSTFYSWIKKLRNNASYDIPESTSKITDSAVPVHQDVVKVN